LSSRPRFAKLRGTGLATAAGGEGRTAMSWQSIGYATACVVIPVLWGAAVVWVSNRVDRRWVGSGGRRGRRRREPPPTEYHI
jgi:hypothetical protein